MLKISISSYLPFFFALHEIDEHCKSVVLKKMGEQDP